MSVRASWTSSSRALRHIDGHETNANASLDREHVGSSGSSDLEKAMEVKKGESQ